MKKYVCECYNVIVDFFRNRLQLVHTEKLSHSKENWNDKVKVDLVRSTFDSIVKIIKLSTNNKVAFVVERLNSDILKHELDNMKFIFFYEIERS